jgi:hypothetical protein
MLRAPVSVPRRELKIDAEPTPVFIWLILAATTAAVLILIVYRFGFFDLDHLVPDGTTFLPYYTT